VVALNLQQRLYPTLRIGLTATVTTERRQGIRLHCRQGEWDGACGMHCAAMALTLLGRLNGATNLASRRNGIAAAFWKAGVASYFDGVSGSELAQLIASLDPTLFVKSHCGKHSRLLKLTQAQLEAGRLVILAWSGRNGRIHHWVVAVGVEGLQDERRFRPSAILCLDPSGPEPVLCGYNGRLELVQNPASYGASYIRYLSNQGAITPATLTEAVVIGGES
jgi:hypothetical protein